MLMMLTRTANPWAEPVTCTACAREMLPVIFAPIPLTDRALEVEIRASLRCTGCGERYLWRETAGWVRWSDP
jgi:hypothetical protein